MKAQIDKQLIEIIVNLHAVFNDYDKIYAWLYTKNLNLGGSAPMTLIQRGRGHRVLQFTQDAADEW